MNKQEIKDILDKSLNMPIGDVSDEWKPQTVVVGESDGVTFVQARAETWAKASVLCGKVKDALSDKYEVVQLMVEFNPVDFRFWENIKVINEKPQK